MVSSKNLLYFTRASLSLFCLLLNGIFTTFYAQQLELVVQTGHSSPVWSVAFSPDGKQIASGSEDNSIKLWNSETGQEIRTFSGHFDSVFSVSFSPDGKQLAVVIDDPKDPSIWVHSLSGAAPPRRLTFGGSSFSPVWSPDGQYLAFAGTRNGREGVFRQRADGSGTEEQLASAEAGTLVSPGSWTPDGSRLLGGTGRGATVSIWMIVLGEDRVIKPLSLGDSPGNKTAPAISPDGKWLATIVGDAEFVNLWDVSTPSPKKHVVRHGRGKIWAAPVFSPEKLRSKGIRCSFRRLSRKRLRPAAPTCCRCWCRSSSFSSSCIS